MLLVVVDKILLNNSVCKGDSFHHFLVQSVGSPIFREGLLLQMVFIQQILQPVGRGILNLDFHNHEMMGQEGGIHISGAEEELPHPGR